LEILRGWGISIAKIFKESRRLNWKFQGSGHGVKNQITILSGGANIFWNHTTSACVLCTLLSYMVCEGEQITLCAVQSNVK